jgi:DNA-binding MarR family transcriptional regulator
MDTTDKNAPLVDPLELYLGYQLRRAAFATQTLLVDSFAAIGVSPTEAIIIRFVRANPGCTQADIGRSIGVKRTNMVPVVTELMSKGLLERSAADGRSHSLYLSEDGAKLLRKINEVALAHEEFFFGDFPDALRQVLMQAFRTLRGKAESWEKPAVQQRTR